jgi:hypothetical protein
MPELAYIVFVSATRALLAIAVVSAVLLPTRLDAQQLRGQVLLSDSSSRVPGVIVVATDARGGVTRTLSGLDGDFLLRLPHAGQFFVQALRIGHRPTVIPPVTVADGETASVRIVLADTPVTLAAVSVRGERVCRISQDSGQLVARMWQEARKAIAATQLTASDEPLVAKWIVFDSVGDRNEKVMRGGKVTQRAGATSAVFVSLSPDSLERAGYVTEDGHGLSYQAPDANVLLSGSFAASHCFHAQPPVTEHADWIGVGFQPSRERPGLADIEGTLWLDRESAELRLLEFRYTGLPRGLGGVESGGRVEFVRLSTGNWIIKRWSLRVPRAARIETLKRLGTLYAVSAMQATGGAVTEIRHAGSVLFSAPRTVGRILGVFDDATGQPLQGAEVIDVEANTKAITSVSGAVSLEFLGADSSVVQIRKIGYYTQMIPVAAPADTVPITVVLKPLVQTLPKVVTTAATPPSRQMAEFEDRRRIGNGHYLTAADIDRIFSSDIAIVLARVPSLHVSGGPGGWTIAMRGGVGIGNPRVSASNLCAPTLFVDGVRSTMGDVRRAIPLMSDIKGIEVYTQSEIMPPGFDYSSMTGCGSIIIWSR